MKERDRPITSNELLGTGGLGNPFDMDGEADGTVAVDYGVYREDLPLGGRTVAEIRRTIGPRYDIGPRAIATIDGRPAAEDTVVTAGQKLRFMHVAGEKGVGGQTLEELLEHASNPLFGDGPDPLGRRMRRRRKPPRITLDGEVAMLTSPEGRTTRMNLDRLLSHLERGGPSVRDTRDLMLPDGAKWVISCGAHTILVHQTPPAVHNLKWIAADSPARHGPETTYRQVRIALPYLVVFAVFVPFRGGGKFQLGQGNECFFRTEPLRSPDDGLSYPALLNCSKFEGPGKPLSWICSQKLVRTKLPRGAGNNERVRQGMADLKRCLLDTGFNYSSDDHEESSWFTETTKVDSRVSTIERWEEATRKDPMFVFDVPWLEVGKSVREVAEQILARHGSRADRPRTSHDVARVLCTHGEVRKTDEGDSES